LDEPAILKLSCYITGKGTVSPLAECRHIEPRLPCRNRR
jgi:hypothetical protein